MTRIAFFGAFAAILLAANLLIARTQERSPLPDYAPWSGVIEIETKLRLLEEFARKGPVDAVIVSSSLGDYGISAETVTLELSRHLGRPFRVFNFGIGGADIPTYPEVYRLARLAAKPTEVWIVAPVSRVNAVQATAFEHHLFTGPLSRYQRIPGLLAASHAFYETPLLRFAPALRDLFLNDDFTNRPATSQDSYPITAYGDTISWTHSPQQYALAPGMVADRHAEMLGFNAGDAAKRAKYEALYFNSRAMPGIRSLREKAEHDGVRLVLVAFDYATSMAGRDEAFARGEQRYFELLSKQLDARLVNAMPDFSPDAYMIEDLIHLNTIGAREFSRALAARMTAAAPPATERFASPVLTGANDPLWSAYSALIPHRPADPAASLELHYLQNPRVLKLRSHAQVAVDVRLPGGRSYIVPARVLPGATVVADTTRIAFAAANEVARVQLVEGLEDDRSPLPIPVGGFAWSAQSYPAQFFANRERARIHSEAQAYQVGERIRVSWQDLEEPSPKDWVGVYREKAGMRERLDVRYTTGRAAGRMDLRGMPPGRYEVRLFRDNGWALAATSEPFEVR